MPHSLFAFFFVQKLCGDFFTRVLEIGLGNITINHEYRQTGDCNTNITSLQYYRQGNIYRIVQY